MPGETWVQRAYRGPSANNPSVSLRNRLRRAAFFDKRERDVAAGVAEPVEMDAGLPDAMQSNSEINGYLAAHSSGRPRPVAPRGARAIHPSHCRLRDLHLLSLLHAARDLGLG